MIDVSADTILPFTMSDFRSLASMHFVRELVADTMGVWGGSGEGPNGLRGPLIQADT
jgi:hypothetical protein